MEYGKLQGEVAAAAHVNSAGTLVGNPFNVASATAIAPGTIGIRLTDGVDPLDCAIIATCDTAPNTATANNAGVDTDNLKQIRLATGESTSGFYVLIVRTN
jgi:hypothetical protein